MSIAQSYSDERSQTELSRPVLSSILVGIDGSQSADDAMQLAALIAERHSSRIDLVHVDIMPYRLVGASAIGANLQPITPESNKNLIEKKELSRTLIMADEAILLDRKNTLMSKNIPCQEISVSSSSADVGSEIVRICNEGKYDLVVVGSRGLSGVASFIPGSVSRRVATEARSSVLVSKFKTDKLERLLLPYDGSTGGKKALAFAAELGAKFGATVNVISVASTTKLSSEPSLSAAARRLEEEMRSSSIEATSLLRRNGIISEDPKVVGAVDISKAIADEAEVGFYDLVVLGNRGQGESKSIYLGGTASGVLLDSSRTNVLIVK